MTLETELRAYTLADATVAGLVGTRMYPQKLPQNPTLPALVYQRIDTRREHAHDGPDQLPRPRMQIAAWASSSATAWDVVNAVRERLDGYRGAMGAIDVQSCLCVGERDQDDPDTGRTGVTQDYLIQFREV
jgi:hypothetical protein